MSKPLLILLLLYAFQSTYGQKKITISGYVTDSLSSESLIAAAVYNQLGVAVGTSTNQFGFYSLTLPVGKVEITYSYIGYQSKVVQFNLQKDTVINCRLVGALLLSEAVVSANITERTAQKTQMSSVNIPMQQIKALPAFLGEVDLMKVLQLTPGVQSGGEGSSGLYVRGGGPDQNLILLDGVPVYNVSHLFGFFSVFNADAINNMELMKGGFPARYGGRTSSVVDINMKEGNTQRFHGEGAIGLISGKLTLEGPLWKDRTSFMVSGRRTYVDLLAKPFIAAANRDSDDEKVNLSYYFYDLTAKVNHKFSDKDRVYLSAYMGDDRFHLRVEDKTTSPYDGGYHYNSKTESGINWGNLTAAFRWNHIFTKKLFGNTAITYSRFRFDTYVESREIETRPETANRVDYQMQYLSGIRDWAAKLGFDYLPSPNHYIRFGVNGIHHRFSPGALGVQSEETGVFNEKLDTVIGPEALSTGEFSAYVEDDFRLGEHLKMNAGVHLSGFTVRNKLYYNIEPRFSTRYLLTDYSSVKASYARMAQYVHLLTNSGISLPNDLWVPTTDVLQPQYSDQLAIGVVQTFEKGYEVSIESYYKKMHHVTEYKEGASFFDAGSQWENKILQGEGRSYGVELFTQKKTGQLTGWIGYTLAWTDRQFEQLNHGKRFPYKYDRRHDLSIVAMYRPSKRIELSGTWVFGTGNAVTLPIARIQGTNPFVTSSQFYNPFLDLYSYSDRNAYRMQSYHRLDLAISFIKKKKWGERRWVVGVYNAYGRRNPFYVDVKTNVIYQPDGSFKEATKFVQYSIFPLVPSISYQFKF